MREREGQSGRTCAEDREGGGAPEGGANAEGSLTRARTAENTFVVRARRSRIGRGSGRNAGIVLRYLLPSINLARPVYIPGRSEIRAPALPENILSKRKKTGEQRANRFS